MPNKKQKNSSYSDDSESTQQILNKSLGPEYLNIRPGWGGTSIVYMEGWAAIDLANRIFGYDGWSSTISKLKQEYLQEKTDKKEAYEGKIKKEMDVTHVSVGYSCFCKIQLKNGAFREDIGYGSAENVGNKSQAIEQAKKGAVTDAIKRALRQFGNALGNCCYNKSHTQHFRKTKDGMVTDIKRKEDLLTRKDLEKRCRSINNKFNKRINNDTNELKAINNDMSDYKSINSPSLDADDFNVTSIEE